VIFVFLRSASATVIRASRSAVAIARSPRCTARLQHRHLSLMVHDRDGFVVDDAI